VNTLNKCCAACGRWGTRGFRVADQSDGHGEGWICTNDRACRVRGEKWMYGFYDSHPNGNWQDDPEPQENPTIYWAVFGFLTHDTAESAMHTGRKSTWGRPVIVRRKRSGGDWEHVEERKRTDADHG
jgi:hypothetical protein